MPELPDNVRMEGFELDVRSGAAIVKLSIESNGHRLTKSSTHTMFSAEWSAIWVLEEIDSAYQNLVSFVIPRGGYVMWSGVSKSGLHISGYAYPDGRIRSAYPTAKYLRSGILR